jgi:hypothetical protein
MAIWLATSPPRLLETPSATASTTASPVDSDPQASSL